MVKCSRAPMDSVNWGAKGGGDIKDPSSNPTAAIKSLNDSGQVI